jgi:hypothetical protein
LRDFQIQTANTGTDTQIGFDFTATSYSEFKNLAAQFQKTGFKLSRGAAGAFSAFFNKFENIYALRNQTGLLFEDVNTGVTPNANTVSNLFCEDVGVWSAGNGLDLSGYGNLFNGIYAGLPLGNSGVKIRNVAGTNQINRLYAESSMTYAIDNSVGTSGRRNIVSDIHVDSVTMVAIATVTDPDLIVFNASAIVDTAANPQYLGAFNTINIRRPEAIASLISVAAGAKTYKFIAGGGVEIGAGAFGIQNTTDGRNPFKILVGALTDTFRLTSTGVDTNGAITIQNALAIPAGGTAGAGLMVSSTANFGIFFGSGVPTLSAAKGSLYLRSDGSSTTTRMYVNTDGATTWTAVTTVA